MVEQGPRWEPPRWLRLLLTAGLGTLVLVVGLHSLLTGDGSSPGAGSGASAASSPGGALSTASSPVPTRLGSCGYEVATPTLRTAPLREATGLTVVVGGGGLSEVDVDSGHGRPLLPEGRTSLSLAAQGSSIYDVTRDRCSGTGSRVVRIGPGDRTSRVSWPSVVGEVVSGSPRDPQVGGVDFRFDDQPILRRTDGRTLRLARGLILRGISDHGLVAEDSTRSRGLLLDPDTGRVLRVLTAGRPVAVGPEDVLLAGPGCSASPVPPPRICVLVEERLSDGNLGPQLALPSGTYPFPGGVMSPDGALAAIQLAAAARESRSVNEDQPDRPSSIVTVDLRRQRLLPVPGVELPGRTSAGLAFADGGRWLLLGIDLGDRTTLLVTRPGGRVTCRAWTSPPDLGGRGVAPSVLVR